MIRALALRLEGPMQSWGGPTAGDDRPSMDVPTKSGVLGLVGALLGIDRDDVAGLVQVHRALTVSVRVDRPGVRGVDFHTAQAVPRVERGLADTVVSRRAYLYDASFTALLVEQEPGTLERIHDAWARPLFAPYLGRRSCPPAVPVLRKGERDLRGGSPLELFYTLALAPDPKRAHMDIYLEGDIAHPGRVRQLRVRDELSGPLARMFRERTVTHLRLQNAAPGVVDTVDPWFPTA